MCPFSAFVTELASHIYGYIYGHNRLCPLCVHLCPFVSNCDHLWPVTLMDTNENESQNKTEFYSQNLSTHNNGWLVWKISSRWAYYPSKHGVLLLKKSNSMPSKRKGWIAWRKCAARGILLRDLDDCAVWRCGWTRDGKSLCFQTEELQGSPGKEGTKGPLAQDQVEHDDSHFINDLQRG